MQQEPASVWFLRYLQEEEKADKELCSICAELRSQESAIILRKKDPDRRKKKAEKDGIHDKYMAHRCVSSLLVNLII